MLPTERFSNRPADYAKGRPGYPATIVPFLQERLQLPPSAIVVDLGAGTGLSSTLFADAGMTVIPIEPNAAMRAACPIPARDGTAESTGLPDQSADLVIAAQAFHWFDIKATARECRRILRPPRNAAAFWNDRDSAATAFMRDYELLIERHNRDHDKVKHTNIQPDSITEFFGSADAWAVARFPNTQTLTREGFEARVTSSSYMPAAGQPGFNAMVDALHSIFDNHQQDGFVAVQYTTRLYYGRLAG